MKVNLQPIKKINATQWLLTTLILSMVTTLLLGGLHMTGYAPIPSEIIKWVGAVQLSLLVIGLLSLTINAVENMFQKGE